MRNLKFMNEFGTKLFLVTITLTLCLPSVQATKGTFRKPISRSVLHTRAPKRLNSHMLAVKRSRGFLPRWIDMSAYYKSDDIDPTCKFDKINPWSGESIEEFERAINYFKSDTSEKTDIEVNDVYGDRYRTALMYASYKGDLSAIDKLISAGAEVDAQDKYGWTALMFAAYSGQCEAIRLLLERGANTDLLNNYAKSAIDIAIDRGWPRVVSLFVFNYGKDKEARDSNELFRLACGTSNYSIVRAMLRYFPVDVNKCDSNGNTPLIKAACKGSLLVVKELLSSPGIQVDLKNREGMTSLMAASGFGNPDIVRLLLEAGANVNITDEHGETAIEYAECLGYTYISEILCGMRP